MTDHPIDPAGLSFVHGARPAEHDTSRLARLADGVRHLRAGRGSLKLNERILMVLAGVVAPLGLILVLIGWHGAAHTPNLFEQVPYLISGGLFGLALVFLGGFFYFAHWLTEMVKESRAQSAAVVDAIGRLESVLARAGGPPVAPGPVTAPSAAAGIVPLAGTSALVATEKGTMAHRPDCVVVDGKNGLRAVTAADGLAPCRLCNPYAERAT